MIQTYEIFIKEIPLTSAYFFPLCQHGLKMFQRATAWALLFRQQLLEDLRLQRLQGAISIHLFLREAVAFESLFKNLKSSKRGELLFSNP